MKTFIKRSLLVISGILVVGIAQAKPAKNLKNKPSISSQAGSKKVTGLWMQTTMGDREVKIETFRRGTDWKIATGPERSRTISQKDVDYLVGEFRKLPVVKRVPASCDRSRIDIVLKEANGKTQKRSGCFGQTTKHGEAFVRYSRLMILAL